MRVFLPCRRKLPPGRAGALSSAQTGAAALARGGINGVDLQRGARALRGMLLHEPLTTVLGQFRDAEEGWTHEKVGRV